MTSWRLQAAIQKPVVVGYGALSLYSITNLLVRQRLTARRPRVMPTIPRVCDSHWRGSAGTNLPTAACQVGEGSWQVEVVPVEAKCTPFNIAVAHAMWRDRPLWARPSLWTAECYHAKACVPIGDVR